MRILLILGKMWKTLFKVVYNTQLNYTLYVIKFLNIFVQQQINFTTFAVDELTRRT